MATRSVDAVDVRKEILDAVDTLLARLGYSKMTMDDVAQAVGIAKGTIYLHFRSKEELVLSHIDGIVADLLEEMRAIADEPSPAAVRIRELLARRVLFRVRRVRHYSASLEELLAEIRSQLLDRRELHFRDEVSVISQVITDGQRRGEFRGLDASMAARAMLLATNSLLPFSLTPRQIGTQAEIEGLVSQISSLMISGILLLQPNSKLKSSARQKRK